MFHGRHFVRYLGICNPICVKLLQVMSGVIPCNLKKKSLSQTLFLKSTNAAYTHTHTHTQTHTYKYTYTHTTIAISEMQCVAFRLKTCACETLFRLWMLSVALVANLRYHEPKGNSQTSKSQIHWYIILECITFETPAFHLTSLEMNLKLYISWGIRSITASAYVMAPS